MNTNVSKNLMSFWDNEDDDLMGSMISNEN